MRSRAFYNFGITHSLTPVPQPSIPIIPELQVPEIVQKNYSPLYKKNNYINPHNTRSRKHRLLQEKNTEIERSNRMLYEKLRKIKLKNNYQSDKKIESNPNDQNGDFNATISKPLSLPQVSGSYSVLNSTKSELNSILEDRRTFVTKYFEQLAATRNRAARKTEEIGRYVCFGWKVKALLMDGQYLFLVGQKKKRQVTKKYLYEKAKSKMVNGLEEWVKSKFQFEE